MCIHIICPFVRVIHIFIHISVYIYALAINEVPIFIHSGMSGLNKRGSIFEVSLIFFLFQKKLILCTIDWKFVHSHLLIFL